MYSHNWMSLLLLLLNWNGCYSPNFPPSIALKWFSEHGCQCLVHRDEDPDILLESIYKEGLCSGYMPVSTLCSTFSFYSFILFSPFRLIKSWCANTCTVGYLRLQNPKTFFHDAANPILAPYLFLLSLCAQVVYEHYSLISLWHLFMPCGPRPPDRLYLKHHAHHRSILHPCVGISLGTPHTLGDSFGSQVFILKDNLP